MTEDFDLQTFKPVEISDRADLDPWLRRLEPQSCEYNFSNLYCWGDIFKVKWKMIDGRLWIYNGRLDGMGFPLGRSITPDELIRVSNLLRAAGSSGTIIQAPAAFVRRYPDLKKDFTLQLDKSNTEYIYSARKLAELRGRKLHRKKNLVNQFRRFYPHHRCKPLARKHFNHCLHLADKWCEVKDCDKYDFRLEMSALRRLFKDFSALEQRGCVLFVEKELVAFSVFDRLNRTTAVVHFEKYHPEFKGASQMINRKTAKQLCDLGYTWVNREQDLGHANLRRAKRSYRPDKLLNSYLLIRSS